MCYLTLWEYVSLHCEHSKLSREHCHQLNSEICKLSSCNLRHYHVHGICSMCREAQINYLAVTFAQHKALREKHQLTGLRATIRINLTDSEMTKHEIEATLKLLQDTDLSGPLFSEQIRCLDLLILKHSLLTDAETKKLKSQRWTPWLPWWDVKKDGDVQDKAESSKNAEGEAEDGAVSIVKKNQDGSAAESEDVDMDRADEGGSATNQDQDDSSRKAKEIDMEPLAKAESVTNNDEGESSQNTKGKGVDKEADNEDQAGSPQKVPLVLLPMWELVKEWKNI